MNDPWPTNIIESMISEHQQLMEYLSAATDISLRLRVERDFSKALLLSAASYFEQRITNTVLDIVYEQTQQSDVITAFVRNKAVTRRYHDWFNWENNGRPAVNANRFFSAFGSQFADHMKNRVANDGALDGSIKAFLELGNLRNQLVHQNYAQFNINKTVPESIELYRTATHFVELFQRDLAQYINNENP